MLRYTIYIPFLQDRKSPLLHRPTENDIQLTTSLTENSTFKSISNIAGLSAG